MNRYGIVVIGYNRVDSIKRTLSRLNECCYLGDQVKLIISIDNSGETDVEQYVKSYKWKHGEKIVKTFKNRLGLKQHILNCGNYLNEFDLDAVAVFEDDIYPSVGFYNFMKRSVEVYKYDNNIAGISLYSPSCNINSDKPFYPITIDDSDVYFMQYAQSWGQVWMKQSWNKFYEWYEENHEYEDNLDIPKGIVEWPKTSWLKYHIKYCVEESKYFVYPYKALATCFSDAGQHALNTSDAFQVPLEMSKDRYYNLKKLDYDAITYDVFFENTSLKNIINNFDIDYNEVNFDLYGLKRIKDKKRFLVSTQILPFKCIKSFGMRITPWELNIANDIKGKDIFLYDTKVDEAINYKDINDNRLNEWMYFYKQIPSWNIILMLINYKLKYKFKIIKKNIMVKIPKNIKNRNKNV